MNSHSKVLKRSWQMNNNNNTPHHHPTHIYINIILYCNFKQFFIWYKKCRYFHSLCFVVMINEILDADGIHSKEGIFKIQFWGTFWRVKEFHIQQSPWNVLIYKAYFKPNLKFLIVLKKVMPFFFSFVLFD